MPDAVSNTERSLEKNMVSFLYRLVVCRVLPALPRIGQASRRLLRRAVRDTDTHIGLLHEETQERIRAPQKATLLLA